MADNEIELPQRRRIDLRDVGLYSSTLVRPKRRDALAPFVDLHLRQIDADRSGVGMPCGERDQVAACRAPDLEYTRRRHIGDVEAEQMSNRGQMPRRGLRKRVGLDGERRSRP